MFVGFLVRFCLLVAALGAAQHVWGGLAKGVVPAVSRRASVRPVVTVRPADDVMPACYVGGGESEWGERAVARKWTGAVRSVLEFGGGAGSVSTVVQGLLKTPTNHVVIQPADGGMFGGLAQLRRNRAACGLHFRIIDHVLEAGEADAVLSLVSEPFDCIVADCEGCLNDEYAKNPRLFEHVAMVQVERDDGGDKYTGLLRDTLGLVRVEVGSGCNGRCTTEVWVRPV
jgi:hypothetical protein